MTVTAEKIDRLMHDSCGSMTFFKRNNGKYMDYTEGVMVLQIECEMFWFIDLMYSHMLAVVDDHCVTEETFYVVNLNVKDNKAKFTITREYYDENTDEYSDVVIAEQDIEYTDLPNYDFKFFLELANYNPLTFRLLCPSEH